MQHPLLRGSLIACSGAVAIVTIAASGCGSGSVVGVPEGEGGAEGSSDGSTGSDSPVGTDGATTDGATTDGAVECKLLGGAYDKTCNTPNDCTTVARGCYCGQQPVIGVAKSASLAAAACEKQAGDDCALGCANFPGQVAEDGQSADDGGTIQVTCNANRCVTVVVR